MISAELCCGSNPAGLPDTAGLVLWELGKDFGCLEQLHHLSPGLRSYLKGGQWLPAADGKAAAGRCREMAALQQVEVIKEGILYCTSHCCWSFPDEES